jgi:hypothetical protein
MKNRRIITKLLHKSSVSDLKLMDLAPMDPKPVATKVTDELFNICTEPILFEQMNSSTVYYRNFLFVTGTDSL